MSDPISYIKSTGGDVDAEFTDPLALELSEECAAHNKQYVDSGTLDDYKTPAFLVVQSSGVSSVPESGVVGYCIVREFESTPGTKWVIQEWFGRITGSHYYRDYRTAWSEWIHTSDANAPIFNSGTVDFNDYVSQGVYILAGAGVTNEPPAANEGVFLLEVSGRYVSGANSWIVQKAYPVNSGGAYSRCVIYENGGFSYNPWQCDSMSMNGILLSSDLDLDDYRNAAGYVVSSNVQHAPENDTGLLTIRTFQGSTDPVTSTWIVQEWIGYESHNVFRRTRRGGSSYVWSEWTKEGAGGSPHPLSGKNVVFMGDSIFGNNQSATGIANLFADATGANVSNFAFGGTRACKRTDAVSPGWDQFDGYSVADAVASGNFASMESALSGGNMSNAPAYFATSLAALKEYDFSECDYIIADWGTNDWTGGQTVEEYSAAMDHIVSTILTVYPNIVFVKTTQFMRFFDVGSGEFENASDHLIGGRTLEQYVESDSHLTEAPYSIQVVDVYSIGINDFTRTHFFTSPDFTHHNENGRRRVAAHLAAEIH